MHRDLLPFCAQQDPLQGCMSTYDIRLKIKQNVSEEVPLHFMLPHKLFAAMFEALPEALVSYVLGGNEKNIANFLEGYADSSYLCVKARDSPIHGDGVAYMQPKRAGRKTLEVLSWCSLLTKRPTKVASFLIFMLGKGTGSWHLANLSRIGTAVTC